MTSTAHPTEEEVLKDLKRIDLVPIEWMTLDQAEGALKDAQTRHDWVLAQPLRRMKVPEADRAAWRTVSDKDGNVVAYERD